MIGSEVEKETGLDEKAALSRDHSRFVEEEPDYRLPYKRDVDRIIHSKAYSRYVDKTQVVYLVERDHVAGRGLHVQLVSNFARGISDIMQLNSGLVEAIALGHDVGHPPFGHEGENYLSALSMEHENGPFCHPYQSCRLLSEIEKLNLGLNVYDGFLCHDGGLQSNVLEPRFGKGWEDHFQDRTNKLENPNDNIIPATLEGCLVKICDTISYLGRDLEDAIHLGILERQEIPTTCLGDNNRAILQTTAKDIIKASKGKGMIAISEEVYQAIQELRKFNFENFYMHPKLKTESRRVEKSYRILFDELLGDLNQHFEQSYIWKNYVVTKSDHYLKMTKPVQMVIDYISGMTNTYFLRTLERLVVPRQIKW